MALKDPEARRAYNRAYQRKWLADPQKHDEHLARVRRNDEKYRAEASRIIQEFKSTGCVMCGETEMCCLSAHHRDPSTKRFSVANAKSEGFSADKLVAELAKCICLCENCHRKVHAGVITLPAL